MAETYFAQWNKRIEETAQQGLSDYAKEYYALETEAYRKILAAYPDAEWSDQALKLAEKLGFAPDKMDIFLGFLEGVNGSLGTAIDLDSVTDDTPISLNIDFKKLYWNMREASAKWLYDLEEWEKVLPKDERVRITKDFNREHIATAEKTGRNDPCPCGSGKKYKNCCGKRG